MTALNWLFVFSLGFICGFVICWAVAGFMMKPLIDEVKRHLTLPAKMPARRPDKTATTSQGLQGGDYVRAIVKHHLETTPVRPIEILGLPPMLEAQRLAARLHRTSKSEEN